MVILNDVSGFANDGNGVATVLEFCNFTTTFCKAFAHDSLVLSLSLYGESCRTAMRYDEPADPVESTRHAYFACI